MITMSDYGCKIVGVYKLMERKPNESGIPLEVSIFGHDIYKGGFDEILYKITFEDVAKEYGWKDRLSFRELGTAAYTVVGIWVSMYISSVENQVGIIKEVVDKTNQLYSEKINARIEQKEQLKVERQEYQARLAVLGF